MDNGVAPSSLLRASNLGAQLVEVGFHLPGGPEPHVSNFHLLGANAYFPDPIKLWTRPALR